MSTPAPTTSYIPRFYTHMDSEKYDRVLVAMKALPAATHANFPQYDGHWDDWTLVVLACNIECKGGRVLEFWQVSIGQRRPADEFGPECWTIYSPQRDSNVGRISLDEAVEITRVVTK